MAHLKVALKKLETKRLEKAEEKKKKLAKEARMYREYIIPEDNNDEYEKNLKTIATKGGKYK